MRTKGTTRRTAVVWSTVCLLLMAPGGVLGAWMQTAKPAAAKPAAAAPATASTAEWPRRYIALDGSQIVLYEPQVASWDLQKKMVAHAALTYTPKGSQEPLIGTIIVEAETRVSTSERLVDISNLHITQSNFPKASKEQAAKIVSDVRNSVPVQDRVLSLDRVLAFVDASLIRPKNVDNLKADPPVIFYSTTPAIVVNLDGEPVWSPIKDNDLRFAVNTNWDLFDHQPSKTFYLRDGNQWLKAAAITGPWSPAGKLPGSFSKLPPDDNWKDVRAALPGVAAKTPPSVFVSTKPAELILLKGDPEYLAVRGTGLLWVSNAEADVFRMGRAGSVYFLVSGRWFSAPDFTGPWTFATPTLPEDFKKIPLEHERSRVLASVPGTTQAAEAVLLAQIPQTAWVSKKDVKAPDVAYQGQPNFAPIESTSLARATNTDKEIIKVGDLYYMCFQGVWFMSRSATGPWEVTGSVPGEIYEIPVTSPAHSVTYVTVEDNNDEWVVFAAAAAYTGVMIGWGCAVWGTGYYYPPYIGYGGFYPVYFPHYPTYGYGAWYNPWTGAYGRGVAAYGPYGGAGVGARYNPRTGTYARGAAAYGPYGARGAAQAYNPRTGTFASTRQGSNVYGSWGATGVQRGDQWAATARTTNNFTGTTTRTTRTSEGGGAVSRSGPSGSGFVGANGSGDVYAGRDGNVYRKDNGGSWQKYDNGGWNSVPEATPQQREQAAARAQDRAGQAGSQSPTVNQLDRDAAARAEGAQRSRDAATARSPSSSGGTGSYRPSGGASRGGGGRRR